MNLRTKGILKRLIYRLNDNPISKQIYKNDIKRRSKLTLTDIYKLSKHIGIFSPYTNEIHASNDFYGHASVLKEYINLPDNYQFKFAIEHGVTFANRICNLETEIDMPSIITPSNFRKNILKKHAKMVFSIGPYIHYAKNYLSEKGLSRERKRLGSNLLVFPTHSTPDIICDYNANEFCTVISKMGKQFDSVRICLYWKDIIRGFGKIYKNYGFECVTAGHVFDPLFLPRLRSIIETSTFTASNDAGTHIGYCIYLNKPHYMYFQKPAFSGRRSEKILVENIYKSAIYKNIIDAFSKFGRNISAQQKNIIDKYWGLSEIKTKKELQNIVKLTEEIYLSNKK